MREEYIDLEVKRVDKYNFNIEYVVIYDQDGKILYKDPDYSN